MAAIFSSAKKLIETTVFSKALAEDTPIPVCVAGTGDFIKVGDEIINAFEYDEDWLMVEVDDEAFNKISLGKGMSRLYGSIVFTVYSPNGQASSGGAVVSDFIYDNFHAVRLGKILLRNVRKIGGFDVKGWRAKVLQVSFEVTTV